MVDWIQMLINISNSLTNLEFLTVRLLQVVGICLIIAGLLGLTHVQTMMQHDSGERKEALLKILAGICFFAFAKYTIPILVNTVFGQVKAGDFYYFTDNINFMIAIKRLVQFAGLIWIALGIHFLIKEDKGGQSENFKGAAYLISGVLALNFEYAARVLNYLFSLVEKLFL